MRTIHQFAWANAVLSRLQLRELTVVTPAGGMTVGRVVEIVQGLGEGMSIVALPAGTDNGDLVGER